MHSFPFLSFLLGPPEFRKVKSIFYNVSNGADASLHISMRAHDTNLKVCQISRYNNQLSTPAVADHYSPPIDVQSATISSHCAIGDNTRENEAVKCQCRVTGIPPELELNVQIHNVSKSIGGHWYGTVSNAFGSGYFEFDIHINIGNPGYFYALAYVCAGKSANACV